MSKELDDYTIACANVKSFQRDHSEILNEYGDLTMQVTSAEYFLKAHARIEGPETNEVFAVSVTHPMRRWYDVDYILEKAPYVRDIPGVLLTTIDKGKVETLAKGGMIDKEIAKAAYHEDAMTPTVTIKRKEAPLGERPEAAPPGEEGGESEGRA